MTLVSLANKQITKPTNKTIVEFDKFGTTNDIISVIMKLDKFVHVDTATFSHNFSENNLYALWYFVKNHIKYVEDKPGMERVKRPSVLWKIRKGDCKSYSLFIGTVLYNLGIPYSYRYVAWNKGKSYKHVYVIAHTYAGDVILDSVHDTYDDEVAYHHKKDIKGAVGATAIAGINMKPTVKVSPLNVVLTALSLYFIFNKLSRA